MPLLGTTEQRIVFSPVEVRNPASSSSTPGSTSNAKTPGKESSSKKGKKKANVGANGIEEVAGSLNPTAEPGPATRSRTSGKKDKVGQGGDDDDSDDDMYATEDSNDADKAGGDKAVEGSAGGEGDVGAGTNADPPPRKKRKPTRNKGTTATQSFRDPTASTTPIMVAEAEPNVAQGRHRQGTPPTGSGIPIAIDPALEALQVSSNQPSPQGAGI